MMLYFLDVAYFTKLSSLSFIFSSPHLQVSVSMAFLRFSTYAVKVSPTSLLKQFMYCFSIMLLVLIL